MTNVFHYSEFSKLRHQSGLPPKELADRLGISVRTLSRYEKGESSPRPPMVESLKNLVKQSRARVPVQGFTFVDLFAGIGGIRRAFDGIGGKCIFTSEWNKYAQQTYLANYQDGPDHKMAGDITKVDAADIPEHDVLLA